MSKKKKKPEKKMAGDSGQSSMENSADVFTHLEEPGQIHNQTPQTQSQQHTQLASTYPFSIINQTRSVFAHFCIASTLLSALLHLLSRLSHRSASDTLRAKSIRNRPSKEIIKFKKFPLSLSGMDEFPSYNAKFRLLFLICLLFLSSFSVLWSSTKSIQSRRKWM